MSKLRKYLKRIAIAAAAVTAILLIVNAVTVTIYTGRFEDRIRKITADGGPVSFSAQASKPIRAEDNAATFLRHIEGDVDAVQKELRPVLQQDEFHDGQLSQQDVAALDAAFSAYPRVIPQLQRAVEVSGYEPDADYTVLPDEFLSSHLKRMQFMRAVARVLETHALLLHSRQDHDAALRTCIVWFHLCRHFDREPLIVSHLVVLACRSVAVHTANIILRSGQVSETAHQELESELTQHDLMKSFRSALRSERAFGVDRYREILDQAGSWPVRAVLLHDACSYLDLIETNMALTAKPYRVVMKAPPESEASGVGKLAGLFLPALRQSREAADRVQAQIRCLRVVNAIWLHAAAGNGKTPPLEKLNLPRNAISDPFTGEPLHVKKNATGWLVYSVGANLRDDSGTLTGNADVGLRLDK